jgi:hypothetical protein
VGVSGLLGRSWELREDLSAYDATYVAVAEAFESPLGTRPYAAVSSQRSKVAAGAAPTCRSTNRPSRNSSRVGMPCTW